MNTQEATNVIWGIIGLVSLCSLWAAWRELMVDELRQSLFKLRDELFDLVHETDGALKFTDPAYVRMRGVLNATIRYAHHLNWTRLIVTMFFGAAPWPAKSVDQVIDDVSDSFSRTQLKNIQRRFGATVLLHLIKASPIMGPLYVAATVKIVPTRVERFMEKAAFRRKIATEVEVIVQDDSLFQQSAEKVAIAA